MNTKLEKLQTEAGQLSARLAELQAQMGEIRARMIEDPLRTAGPLAQSWAQRQIESEVIAEKLSTVQSQVKAEQDRINSPEVQAGIKRAGKLIAENQEQRAKIGAQVTGILSQINDAMAKANEAGQLLRNGGQDPAPAGAGAIAELGALAGLLNGWAQARDYQASYTAEMRKAQADRAAREAAAAKQEADQPKTRKPFLNVFQQVRN